MCIFFLLIEKIIMSFLNIKVLINIQTVVHSMIKSETLIMFSIPVNLTTVLMLIQLIITLYLVLLSI